MNLFGLEVRATNDADRPILISWSKRALDAAFWLKQKPGIESFLVSQDNEPIAAFQVEHVKRDQVRLHLQGSPFCSPRKILKGITKLVPLIEQALRLRGVTAIFFTSHSLTMAKFMFVHLEYEMYSPTPTPDGWIMAKRFPGKK